MKNRRMVIFNLKEAKEQLDELIKDYGENPKYDAESFEVEMAHIYHHLNTAWNSRNVSHERAVKCAQSDFDKWRQFPKHFRLLNP
jgi:hypothetical protein